jgi:hypothetical protein
MIGRKKYTSILAALFLFGGVVIGILWMFDFGAPATSGRTNEFSEGEVVPVRSRSERRADIGRRESNLRSTSGQGNRRLGVKAERDQVRAEAQDAVRMILDGASILGYLSNYTGREGLIFLEELRNGLRADLKSSGEFGKIEKIFNDLAGDGKSHTGLKISLLRSTANFESGSGVSSDVKKKMELFEIFNRSDHIMSFSKYLAKIGAEKASGPIDEAVMSAIPAAERKSLLWGMARSGDLDAITTVLGVQEETERGALLDYTVKELMRNHPGKTISHIDEMQDPVQRTFCLTVAVESLRTAGATAEADEWAMLLQEDSDLE